MHLIFLGGNSAHNREWIEAVAGQFKGIFSAQVQYYDHWKTGKQMIDVDRELETLVSLAKNHSEYAIFAKSAGTMVSLKGIAEGRLKPKKCIFVGMPLMWEGQLDPDGEKWLKGYTTPTLFIQQTQDPYTTFAYLKLLLERLEVKNSALLEVPGNDHDYSDMAMLKKEVISYLQKKN